jgi:hypothetical protein
VRSLDAAPLHLAGSPLAQIKVADITKIYVNHI